VCKLTAGVGVLPLVTSSAVAENNTRIDVGAGENGFQFDSDDVVIEVGTSVVWEWTGSGGAHNVVHDVDDPEFESKLADEDGYTFSHTFEEPGTYEYVCTPHRAQGMSGRVRVEPKEVGARVDVGAGENGFQFDSDDVVIKEGTSVVWEWTGNGGAHNIVSDDDKADFESELTDEDGYIFSHTFEESGTYEYVCVPHRAQGMSGRVRVEPEEVGARVDVGAGENGFQFDSDDVVIKEGTSVVWEWTGDGGAHNIVHDVDDPEFESELTDEGGYIFSHTFEESGTYEYVCVPHRAQGMSGRVRVETQEEESQSIADRPDMVSVAPGETVDIDVTVDPEDTEFSLVSEELSESDGPLEIDSVEAAAQPSINDRRDIVDIVYLAPMSSDTISYTIAASSDATVGEEYTLSGTAVLSDETEATTGSTTIRIEEESGVSEYANNDGVVETSGLTEAIKDWRGDEVDVPLLLDIINAWRSEQPVS